MSYNERFLKNNLEWSIKKILNFDQKIKKEWNLVIYCYIQGVS